MNRTTKPSLMQLKQCATDLKLHGLLAHWEELEHPTPAWVKQLLHWEENERHNRGLQRRLRNARLGSFKPLVDFDWQWPKQLDQASVLALMNLSFIQQDKPLNPVFIGGNGIGKTTIAKNIAHQAVLNGYSVIFTTAAQMLNDLAAIDSDSTLKRRLKYYAQPQLLVIDELGYLSYSNRHADLLFEIVNRRYEIKSTLVTTNRPFDEWDQVFPNAACVVSLVDRLIHHSEIIVFEGDSYRMKEATEKKKKKTTRRKS
jgi:DNA replication protein DnaC